MVDIAMKHFTTEEATTFLTRQALGVFFTDMPMRWYGSSPLGYAVSFGLKDLVIKILETGLTTLDSKIVFMVQSNALANVAALAVCTPPRLSTRQATPALTGPASPHLTSTQPDRPRAA